MLETERLILRTVVYDDASAIFDYCKDEETTRYVRFKRHVTIEDTYEQLEKTFLNRDPKKRLDAFAIVDKKSGRMIGTVDASEFKDNNSVELGYMIHKDFWNKGVMTEAVSCVARWLILEKDLHRIELTHNIENEASKKVALKCGFVFEGIRRAYRLVDGEYIDLPFYSLLKRDLV